MQDPATFFVRRIWMGMGIPGCQRSGQALFNSLPEGASAVIAGTAIDPFYKDLSHQELFVWVDEHCVFGGDRIIGIINNNRVIWEEQ